MIMDIKNIIYVNKFACNNIASLESAINASKVKDDKDKANFGNLCIALHGFRMIANATEAILRNEDVIKGKTGKFYQKVDDVETTPEPTEGEGDGTEQ